MIYKITFRELDELREAIADIYRSAAELRDDFLSFIKKHGEFFDSATQAAFSDLPIHADEDEYELFRDDAKQILVQMRGLAVELNRYNSTVAEVMGETFRIMSGARPGAHPRDELTKERMWNDIKEIAESLSERRGLIRNGVEAYMKGNLGQVELLRILLAKREAAEVQYLFERFARALRKIHEAYEAAA